MIVVHSLPPAWDLPSVSPFCLKLLTFLNMARLHHEVRVADLQKAPKGKVPWIELDGEVIPDTEHILRVLGERFPIRLDDRYDTAQLARGHALRRMLEEHTYFALVWDRWIDEDRWNQQLRPEVAKLLPALLRPILLRVIRKGVRKQLWNQGIARHDRATIMAKALADLDATDLLLGDNAFMLGKYPSSIDAAAYGVLASIAFGPCSPELQTRITGSKLGRYCERMRDRYWAGEDQPTMMSRSPVA